jgi:hypothetical protein
VQDEIALQGAGRDPGPLAPGPHGHLGAPRGQGGREAPRRPRAAAAQRPQQPVQGGRARRVNAARTAGARPRPWCVVRAVSNAGRIGRNSLPES